MDHKLREKLWDRETKRERKKKNQTKMVTGWRRAFCTSIPIDRETNKVISTEKHQNQHCENSNRSPRISSKFGFFSNPSTPRLQSQPVSSSCLILLCREFRLVSYYLHFLGHSQVAEPRKRCNLTNFFFQISIFFFSFQSSNFYFYLINVFHLIFICD